MPQIESPDLASPRFKADPYPFYARLRADAPVHRARWTFLRLPAWIVTRYDDVLAVLRDERFSKEFPAVTRWAPRPIRRLTRNLLGLDAPDHTRLRALVGQAFTPRIVDRLRPRIEQTCNELLDAAAARGEMDLVREYALPLPVTVIADLLGIPRRDRHQFASWSKRFTAGTSGALRDVLPGWWAMWRFGRYFRSLVARRRTTACRVRQCILAGSLTEPAGRNGCRPPLATSRSEPIGAVTRAGSALDPRLSYNPDIALAPAASHG